MGALRRHPLLSFLVIAFGYSWAIWIAMFLIHDDHVGVYKAAAMFGPALGFLVVRKWITAEGFSDAGFRWGGKGYYGLAWLGPPLLFALAVALSEALGGATWGLNTDPEMTESAIFSAPDDWPLGAAIAVKIALNATVGLIIVMIFTLGEDLGWFGYLVPRLVGRLGPVRGALCFGLIWACWHLPIYVRGHNNPDESLSGLLVAMGWTVAMGVLMTWLRLRSRSLWVPALAHASGNSMGLAVFLFATDVSETTFFGCSVWVFGVLAAAAAWNLHRRPPAPDGERGDG